MLETLSGCLPFVYIFFGFICILGGLAPGLVTSLLPTKYGVVLASDVRFNQERQKRALGYITICGAGLATLASVSWNGRVAPSDIVQLAVPALVLTAIARHFASTVWTRSASKSDAGV